MVIKLLLLGVFLTTVSCNQKFSATIAESSALPNIVIILADDLGIGDVSGLNPEGKIPTPHIDSLIHNGLTFNNGHTTSAVCTPTRYSLLTGRYNWRSKRKSWVAGGFSQAEIEKGRATLASLLKKAGYNTAMVGKWHLGANWKKLSPEEFKKFEIPPTPSKYQGKGKSSKAKTFASQWQIDYTKPFRGGPVDYGFDYYFGIIASADMPPYLYLRNDLVIEQPTTIKAFFRPGVASANFEAKDLLTKFSKEASAYIEEQANAKSRKPFFLYVPLTSPHTPIVPSKDWAGKSEIQTKYADFTMETDGVVGQILKTLKEQGLIENTLVIFTADNGCSPAANYRLHLSKKHNPSYIYRGHKTDLYEGGHRVPFIVQWPAQIKQNQQSNQLVSVVDFLATFAQITQQTLTDREGEDSISFLPILQGTPPNKSSRKRAIYHSGRGKFAIQQNEWKLIVAPGSGGWTPLGKRYRFKKLPAPSKKFIASFPPMQLFNMKKDPGEYHNLLNQRPEVAKSLLDQLEADIKRGRTTHGERQLNNGKVPLARPSGW